jgi:hypothetical protein
LGEYKIQLRVVGTSNGERDFFIDAPQATQGTRRDFFPPPGSASALQDRSRGPGTQEASGEASLHIQNEKIFRFPSIECEPIKYPEVRWNSLRKSIRK